MPKPTLYERYDAAENIVYVTFPKVHLDTKEDIEAHFDRALAFWRTECGGKPVYYVVNYDGFSVNLRENTCYAEQMKRLLPTAITIVRFGGDPLQRTAARLYNMKIHSPTRLYNSREEALAVVRALKAGEMDVERE